MKYGLCLETVFTSLPLEERMAKAAELGFQNVEMWLVDSTFKGKPEKLAQHAKNAGVTITNTVIGSPDGSIGGGLTDPRCRHEWLERTKKTLAFNQAAAIKAAIVCTGNIVNGLTYQQTYDTILEGLEKTLHLAQNAGVTLLLEPLNTPYDHPGYWLAGSNRGAEICRKFNSPYLKLLYDCYHMQIMEGDLLNHIQANISAIGHFHAAAVPGRHEVFNGEINYPFLVKHIEALGYTSIFALEYVPKMENHTESLRRTLEYLRG